MKKIILAVASVLALGMLVSCKQEASISGSLTVSETTKSLDATTTETYFYKFAGNKKMVADFTQTTYTKTSYTGDATKTASMTQKITYEPKTNAYVKLTVTKNPNTNDVTYKYELPAFAGEAYTEYTSYVGTTTTSKYYSTTEMAAQTKYVYLIDNKYYYDAYDGSKIVLTDFNPTADEIDFSKIADVASSTTSYSGYSKNADGKEQYNYKFVTETKPTYDFKLAKY